MNPTTYRRRRILEVARSWLGTPFHHGARVKGAGVDCAQFLAAVYEEAGIVEQVALPATYPPDWFLHQHDSRYVDGLLEHTRRVDTPEPGDLAAFQFGRSLSHGAIVVAWPTIIHAYVDGGVLLDDAMRNARLAERYRGSFSPFPAVG